MPSTEVPRGIYESKAFLVALQRGLGSKLLVGFESIDFDQVSTKSVFFAKNKKRDGMRYYVYFDESLDEKVVARPRVNDEAWVQSVDRVIISRFDYLPMKLIEMTNYWYSHDAEVLFEPCTGETAHEAAAAMFELLSKAANDRRQLKNIIVGLGDDEEEIPVNEATGKRIVIPAASTERLLAHLKMLCVFMARALSVALEHDGFSNSFSWLDICGKAVKALNDVGILAYQSETGKSIREWFVIFRKQRKFPNPLLEIRRHGPHFLLAHPDTVTRMKEYGNANLKKLTCDFMREWLIEKEIPRVVAEYNNNVLDNDEDLVMATDEYLAQYHLGKICRATVHNWLLFLGFELLVHDV
ncbi:MAG: hypothetical protein SGARI_005900 [Bacillariaceae sp.]